MFPEPSSLLPVSPSIIVLFPLGKAAQIKDINKLEVKIVI
jgi:hypothetical protein